MKKKWICLLTALAVAVGVCAVKPVISGAAPVDPVDLGKECALNIQPVNWADTAGQPQTVWDEMKKAKIVVDLYKVADAVKVEGYDTYTFEPAEIYKSLNISGYSDLQKLQAADWDDLAQKAAIITLGGDSRISADRTSPISATGTGEKLEGLDAGLYLAVARGASDAPKLSDYVHIEWKKDENGKEIEGNIDKIYTFADSDRYEFSFLPQLIALPTKEAVDGEISTSNPGEWQYRIDTVLKSGVNPRYGSLRIRKSLLSYETVDGKNKPVTFAFHITGTLPAVLPGEETLTCDKYESITFTGAGQEYVIVENIPATMEVTIEEEYSGVTYEADETKDVNGKITKTAVIRAGETEELIASDEIANVDFRNVYKEGENPGSGIKNTFTYQNGKWEWSSDPNQSGSSENE